MSYVARKTLMFKSRDDPVAPLAKRSEARLKNYLSETDARSWTTEREERRQHILELIRRKAGKCGGKYVPIETLIEILLANKDAEIEKLKKQIEQLQALLSAYEKLELTDSQKAQLSAIMRQIEEVSGSLSPRSDSSASSKITNDDLKNQFDELVKIVQEDVPSGKERYDEDKEHYKGDKGQYEDDKGRYGDDKEMYKDDKQDKIKARADRIIDKDGEELSQKRKGVCGATTSSVPPCAMAAKEKAAALGITIAPGQKPCEVVGKSQVDFSGIAATLDQTQSLNYTETTDEVSSSEESPRFEGFKEIYMSKDAEIAALKNALIDMEVERDKQKELAAAVIEQLENLKEIAAERDNLQNKLLTLETEVNEVAVGQTVSAPCKSPCAASAPEATSPQEEVEQMRKELEELKECCDRLTVIQNENDNLKSELEEGVREREQLIEHLEQLNIQLTQHKIEKQQLESELMRVEEELSKYKDLPENLDQFKESAETLDKIMSERDELKNRMNSLKSIEDETIELREKADKVEKLESLVQSLQEKCGWELSIMEEETKKVKANNECACKEIEDLKMERDSLKKQLMNGGDCKEEVNRLRSRAMEADVYKNERDRLKIRVDELAIIEKDFMDLIEKTKGLELIKAEREVFKHKYEELLRFECECEELRVQVERAKALDNERDFLREQIKQLELCIAEQEGEIAQLVIYVEKLAQGREDQQARVSQCLCEMRNEIEKKDSIIAASEEQLARVQDHLKTTISEVSFETSQMKEKLEILEVALAQKESEIEFLKRNIEEKDEIIRNLMEDKKYLIESKGDCKCKDNEMESLKCELKERDEIIKNLKEQIPEPTGNCKCKDEEMNELKALLDKFEYENKILQNGSKKALCSSDDGHLSMMLEQSKIAMKKIVKELDEVLMKNGNKNSCDFLNKKIKRLERELEEAKNTSKDLAKTERASMDITPFDEEIKELTEQLTHARKKISSLETENGELSARLTDVEQNEELVNQLSKQIEEMYESYNNERNEWMKKSVEMDNILQENNNMHDEIKNLIIEINCMKGQKEELKTDLENINREFRETMIRMEGENNTLKQEITNYKEDICKLAEREDRLKTQLRSVHDQLEKKEDEMDSMIQASETKLVLVENQKITLQERLLKSDGELLAIEDENIYLHDELEKYKSWQAKSPCINKPKRGECTPCQKEKGKSPLTKERERRREAEKRIRELEDTLTMFKLGTTCKQVNICELQRQMEKLKQRNLALSEEIDSMKGDDALNDLRRERDKLLKELEDQKKHEIDTESAIPPSSEKVIREDENVNAELEKERKEKSELEAMVKQLEENLNNMSKQVFGGDDELSKKVQDIIDLEERLRVEQQKAKAADDAFKQLQASMATPDLAGDVNLQVENTQLQIKVNVLEEENAKLTALLKEKTEEANMLQMEVNKKDVQPKEIEPSVDELTSVLNKLKECEDKLKLQENILKEKDNELMKQLNVINELKGSEEGSKSLEGKLLNTDEQIKKLEELLRQKENEVAEKLKQKDDEIKNQAELLKEKDQKINELGSVRPEGDEKLIQKLKENDDELKRLLEELKQKDNEMKNQEDRLKQKDDELKRLDDMQTQGDDQIIKRLQEKDDELKRVLEQLKQKDDEMKNQEEEFRKLSGVQQQDDQMMQKLKEKDDELKKLMEQLKQKDDEISKFDDILRQKDEKMSEMMDTLKQIDDENKRQTAALSQKELEMKKQEEMLKEKEDRGNELRKQSDILKQTLKESESTIKRKELSDMNQKAEMKKLSDMLGEKDEEIKRLKKQDMGESSKLRDDKKKLEEQLKKCQDEIGKKDKIIATMKIKHENEIKDIKNRYNSGVAKLQSTHEIAVDDVSKLHERELEGLRDELKKCKATCAELEKENKKLKDENKKSALSIKTLENANIPPTQEKACACGQDPELESMLERILKDGLESLAFEDLQYLHTKLCDATANVLNKTGGGPTLRPQETEKYMLMKRNFELEKDLIGREKEAQNTISMLEMRIHLENKKLTKLKTTLVEEKKKNVDLSRKLKKQMKTACNMQVEVDLVKSTSSVHESSVQNYTVEMEKEKSKVKELQENLNREMYNAKNLKDMLDVERESSKFATKKAAQQLENLRIELQKSLRNETILRQQLEQTVPKKCRPSNPEKVDKIQKGKPNANSNTFYTELTTNESGKKCKCAQNYQLQS